MNVDDNENNNEEITSVNVKENDKENTIDNDPNDKSGKLEKDWIDIVLYNQSLKQTLKFKITECKNNFSICDLWFVQKNNNGIWHVCFFVW